MAGLELLAQAKAAGLNVEAHGSELVIKGPKRAEAIARMLFEHKTDVLAALDASPAKSSVTMGETQGRRGAMQCEPAPRRVKEAQCAKHTTITYKGETFELSFEGIWFFRRSPEAGWTSCSPEFVAIINKRNQAAALSSVQGSHPTVVD